MSMHDKDAAKRAAAGESLGAVVTLEMHKLDREELMQVGMREMLDKYLLIVRKRFPATHYAYPMAYPLIRMMQEELEGITVELTKSAMRHKAGSMMEIPGVKS